MDSFYFRSVFSGTEPFAHDWWSNTPFTHVLWKEDMCIWFCVLISGIELFFVFDASKSSHDRCRSSVWTCCTRMLWDSLKNTQNFLKYWTKSPLFISIDEKWPLHEHFWIVSSFPYSLHKQQVNYRDFLDVTKNICIKFFGFECLIHNFSQMTRARSTISE